MASSVNRWQYAFATSILVCIAALSACGQVIIWQDDFSAYPNGTQQNAPDWTTTFFDTDDAPPQTVNGSFWGVDNGEFRNNDVEGVGQLGNNYFTTRYFSITGYNYVTLSATFRGTGGLDAGCGPGCLDFILFEYSLNGGPWTQWATNGYIFADVPPDPLPNGASAQGCLTGDSIAIRITMGTMANDENLYFDNLVITGYTTNGLDAGNDISICTGQSAQLNVTGATNPQWSPNVNLSCTACFAPLASPGSTQQYIVSDTDPNGCQVSDTVVVNVSNQLSVQLGNDTTLCNGQAIVLNAGNPGANYLWNGTTPGQNFTVTTAGQYTVLVDLNGCIGADTIQVNFGGLPAVNLGADQNLCNGGNSVVLDAGAGNTSYSWNGQPGTQFLTVTQSGTYTAVVSNACGSSSDQVNILIGQTPVVDLGPDVSLCNQTLPFQLDAGVFPQSLYNWSTGSAGQTISVNSDGTYWVEVSNACGTDADTLVVAPAGNLVPPFGEAYFVCDEAGILLDAENPGAQYSWNTGDTTATLWVDTDGIYIVQIQNCGITLTDTAKVTFLSASNVGIYLPNVFTPNHDFINDTYEIGLDPALVDYFRCRIFNRWGMEIFSSDNPYFQWDGTYLGSLAAEGTYYIVVDIEKYCGNEPFQQTTFITLIR